MYLFAKWEWGFGEERIVVKFLPEILEIGPCESLVNLESKENRRKAKISIYNEWQEGLLSGEMLSRRNWKLENENWDFEIEFGFGFSNEV